MQIVEKLLHLNVGHLNVGGGMEEGRNVVSNIQSLDPPLIKRQVSNIGTS